MPPRILDPLRLPLLLLHHVTPSPHHVILSLRHVLLRACPCPLPLPLAPASASASCPCHCLSCQRCPCPKHPASTSSVYSSFLLLPCHSKASSMPAALRIELAAKAAIESAQVQLLPLVESLRREISALHAAHACFLDKGGGGDKDRDGNGGGGEVGARATTAVGCGARRLLGDGG